MATSCPAAWADAAVTRVKLVHPHLLCTIRHSLAPAALQWALTLTRLLLAAPTALRLVSALLTILRAIRRATDLPVQLCTACQSRISCHLPQVRGRCITDRPVSLTSSIVDHLVAHLCITKARHATAPAAV